MVFTLYYLIAAEQADEKVRKVRGSLTLEHLRVSWNKGTTPYLASISRLLRPRLSRYSPKKIRIPRPPGSSYEEPIAAWIYYDGPFSAIGRHTKIVLDIPGGGFVAMDPRTNDDKLFAWSGRTGLPIVSLDYKKAPEYPYPYALNECFDAYCTLIASNGRCIGLSGEFQPRVVLTGDSAGGNLATGVTLMTLQSAKSNDLRSLGETSLPMPEGLILIYPGLDMNINSWMTDEQMSLIQDQRTRARNRNILRKKSEDYYKLDPSGSQPSDEKVDHMLEAAAPTSTQGIPASRPEPRRFCSSPHATANGTLSQQQADVAISKPRIPRTRLAMSSMISYFNDRILTPEMMRAMIILYVGPHARPDFTTDYLLSPILAPEALLAEFPKTYFLTGERDPLVDDTVIFAGRLRQAKYNMFVQRKELGLLKSKEQFNERDHVEVALIPGISHGFLQFVGVFPQGWKHINRCASWIVEVFGLDVHPLAGHAGSEPKVPSGKKSRHHFRTPTDSSGDEDRPLEMTPINANGSSNSTVSKGSKGKGYSAGKGKGNEFRRRRSGLRLGSQEDLLKRRMKGLASSLMGNGDDEGMKTP